jgi:hypothetical protein
MPDKLTFEVDQMGQHTIRLQLNKNAQMWNDLSASECLITAGGEVVTSAEGLSCNSSGLVMVILKNAKWNNCPAAGNATVPEAVNCPPDGWHWTLV